MKVTLLSHSDTIGGASIVTYRLMKALQKQGVDARMLVFTKTLQEDDIEVFGTRFKRGLTFLAERARIAVANGFDRKNLFKVSVANTGLPYHLHPWIEDTDVIVLGWINQGMASLKEIGRICQSGKPVVWIMHDMWNMTGICHHAYECDKYRNGCGECTFLGKFAFKNDISRRTSNKKKKLYDKGNMTFVAVSNWLAQRAANSLLLKGRDVKVIPNAFPIDSFYTRPKLHEKVIDTDKNIILMGAARLDDPIKGLPYAIDALNHLFDNRPDVARNSVAVFFGDLRDRSILDNLRFPHIYFGRINDFRTLRELYAQAKVVLSTSHYETLPGTLIEGQASGCLPVTFGNGGQADIVTHRRDGYIAEYKNPESVAEGIAWALENPTLRSDLHESVRRNFSADAVAKKHIELYKELLNKNKSNGSE